MKILVAHNRYQQPGGEDLVVENEIKLLASAGHEVSTLIVSNDVIKSNMDKLVTMLRTADNPSGAAAVSDAIEKFRPEIVHFHNFFPLISPLAYKACRKAGVAVVQTLHNYRTICPGGQLMRDGQICELCVHGSPIWGVVHRCYRGSLVGSAAVSYMVNLHRKRQTWSTEVDRFIALSEFSRRVFVEAGFPESRIEVKPNFMDDPGEPPPDRARSGVLFVGRLSKEKGAEVLVRAAAKSGFELRIAGDGPELESLRRNAAPNIRFLGRLPHDAILEEVRRAAVLAIPSLWYEAFPMVVLEAFASATPVVASRLGALADIVEDGVTGLHATKGDAANLAERIVQLLCSPMLARRLGHQARTAFLRQFTREANLPMLEGVYARAVEKNACS
jgi:glycosyltransferase involved in cell wall biosynthesis